MAPMRHLRHLVLAVTLLSRASLAFAADVPDGWKRDWRNTDFSRRAVDFSEILPGGPPKDGIPSIDRPRFETNAAAGQWLADRSPVISITIDDDARAYPLAILIQHEIVNDRLGRTPVAVTYCPLCNAAVVFVREAAGRELDFGTTGKLRFSDLVMYDRQTESWWQQYTGAAIVGALTGTELERLPARLESFGKFKQRFPNGRVLQRPADGTGLYGFNPYRNYDSSRRPLLYDGALPDTVPPLSRVVSVGGRAWSLALLRGQRRIETADGLVLTWEPGQASALDKSEIATSRDVGNVVVQRQSAAGLQDVVYGVDFAFAFKAFHPDARITTELDQR